MAIISHSRRFIFVKPRKVGGSSIQHALSGLCSDEDVLSASLGMPGLDSDDFADIPPRNADWGDLHGLVRTDILPARIRERVGERVWNDYLKITVSRNPWDLFVSLCWFAARMPPPKQDLHRLPIRIFRDLVNERRPRSDRATKFRRQLTVSVSRKALRRRLESGRRPEAVEFALRRRMFADYLSEIPQFYLCGGQPYADCTIRFHRLEEDFREVCRRLGNGPSEHPTLLKLKTETRPEGDDYRAYYTDWSKARVEKVCRPMIELFGYRFDRPEPRAPLRR